MRCTYAVGRTGEISSVDSDEFGSGVLMRLHEHKESKKNVWVILRKDTRQK